MGKKQKDKEQKKEFIQSLPPLLDDDVPYEEEILRNPYVVKSWVRYLEFKEAAPFYVRNVIYERALKELPGSYKLWAAYLRERVQQVRAFPLNDPAYDAVNNAFDRCLVLLHKMPRIWLEYGDFLIRQRKFTLTRRVFDRALRSLPLTQHDRMWKLYIKFIRSPDVPSQTGVKVFRRYLKVEPDKIEDFVDYLISVEEWEEAATHLVKIVNNDDFQSPSGKTKHDFWMQLSDIMSKHPSNLTSLNVDRLLRGGLKKFSEDTGKLWVTLADYYIRQSLFDKARDVFEEGMATVLTVRDFTQIWDAYAKFEDSLIAMQVETMNKSANAEENEEEMLSFDLRMARYENLIARQPLLVNSVLLRQNPHNVHEWRKRAKLHTNPKMIVDTYATALATVDPQKAKGKPHLLWIDFAEYYESLGDLDKARQVFERAAQANLKFVDDLASIWCASVEMELRYQNYPKARELLQRATTPPRTVKSLDKDPVQKKLYRSTKLWSLYADVEQSVGTFMNAKAVYERITELKVASPQIIIHFANFLEENKYYEESFKAYEKGTSLFKFPYVSEIWITYLTKFVERYGGKKLERARELFEQVVESAPAKDAKVFYIMYANLEEQYGLARHAMNIYDRATRAVAEEDRFAMYALYINRATEYFGVTKTREIYEQAIGVLPDQQAKKMSLRYAELERRLGEIDRARAILIHASQFSDPRTDPEFWIKWREFEATHGNQDTFREMLKIRRSVQAQFNTSVNIMAAEILADKQDITKITLPQSDMEILERAAALAAADEAKKKAEVTVEMEALVKMAEGTDALDLEEPGEGKGEEEFKEEVAVEQLQVPQAIFDRNIPQNAPQKGNKESQLGALAKQKRKR